MPAFPSFNRYHLLTLKIYLRSRPMTKIDLGRWVVGAMVEQPKSLPFLNKTWEGINFLIKKVVLNPTLPPKMTLPSDLNRSYTVTNILAFVICLSYIFSLGGKIYSWRVGCNLLKAIIICERSIQTPPQHFCLWYWVTNCETEGTQFSTKDLTGMCRQVGRQHG